jgi:carboxyl-terminal processing protease
VQRSSRQLPTPLLVALALAVLVVGIYWGGHPSALPGPLRDALVADDGARTYDEALDIIQRDYYRKVDRSKLERSSLDGVVRSLHDRFSNYFDPSSYRKFKQQTDGEVSGVGLAVTQDRRGLRVQEVFAGSPAKRAGIRAGDIVLAVDGRSLRGRSSSFSTALIQGRPGTRVRLTLMHHGHRRSERITRARVSVPVVSSRMRSADGHRVLQVALAGFTSGAHGELRAAIDRGLRRGARGVVLDLRGNGGGLLTESVLVSSIFIPDGPIVSTRGRARPRVVYDAKGSSIPRRVPVVVLVDRGTASAAEIVTGALQDRKRARVVGTRTFGKGVFQEIEQLSNGGALDITVGEYFLPSGRNLGGGGVAQGAGIKPDVVARDRRATRRDEALDAALKAIAPEL